MNKNIILGVGKKASQHKMTKPGDLTASVNDAVVQGKFMLLSGGYGFRDPFDVRSVLFQSGTVRNRLKLVVNTTKSHVVKAKDCQFLGFTFGAGRIQWHSSSLHNFKREVRRLTNRNWGVPCATSSSGSANIYVAGLTTLALPTATASVSNSIIGFDAVYGWHTGDNSGKFVPE